MPKNNPRPEPVIPDHEVLRKIGGGAYGEVWLARGVTGALRAVKVVYREDFDSERSFEREFEGILKFEPISRDHPGLVNILHVGRSPDFSFYYYVMELGDDVTSGREISTVEYEARTLSSDIKRTPGRRLSTAHAIDSGLRLAEALRHMHDSNLAHRDVKPANVIFVNGKAKLADIGLVAARGQRTFVGTEGFVPPEGPGSAQADVYSLGKVLYEMATGKDRLDFPELPDELPAGPERKLWQALNQIICDVCEPQLSKRKISTAADLSDALRRLQQGKRRKRRGRPIGSFFATLLIVAVLGAAGWKAIQVNPEVKDKVMQIFTPDKKEDPPPPPKVLVRISSKPVGAHVFKSDGTQIGDTPSEYWGNVHEKVSFRLEHDGYKTTWTDELELDDKGEGTPPLYKELKNFSPPMADQPWKDQEGQIYQLVPPGPAGQGPLAGEYHLMADPVEVAAWSDYAKEKNRPAEVAEFVEATTQAGKAQIVLTGADEAKAFCAWLTAGGLEKGYLTDRNELSPVRQTDFSSPAMSERAKSEGLRPFRCQVRTVPYARIEIATSPPGAEIYVRSQGESGEVSAGFTTEGGPLAIEELKQGETALSIVLEGYKPYNETVVLKPGETLKLDRKLEPLHRVNMDRPWENTLGMRFVPVAKDLMACVWETRVRDYHAYVQAGEHRIMPPPPDFVQDDLHPIVGVSRQDANSFCEWLTQKEQSKDQDQHTSTYVYRLPTDYEWSQMVGLSEEPDPATPARRDNHQAPAMLRYLWGTSWPPPDGYANLADGNGGTGGRVIEGYHDAFKNTAPVGSFLPYRGIFDLCGNVNEWVSDNYRATDPVPFGVLRGGAWNTYQAKNLYLGCRIPVPPDYRDDACGFRVMFAKIPPAEDKPVEKPPEERPAPPDSKPSEETPPPPPPIPDHG